VNELTSGPRLTTPWVVWRGSSETVASNPTGRTILREFILANGYRTGLIAHPHMARNVLHLLMARGHMAFGKCPRHAAWERSGKETSCGT